MPTSFSSPRKRELFWETIERLETENLALKDFIFRQINHLDPTSHEDIHLLKRIVEGRTSEAA